MDFAALMSKELGKTKKPAAEDKKTKYMKRADIEAEREAAYKAEQEALEAERQAKAAAKRKREEDEAATQAAREEKRQRLAEESRRRRRDAEWEEEQARRKRLGLPPKSRPEEEDAARDSEEADARGALEEGAEDIPEEELVRLLRELGHPAVLFGESHGGRVRRYRRLTTVVTDGPIPTTLRPVDEKDMKVDGAVPKDKEGRRWLYRQLASYFSMVLTEYQRAMDAERRDTQASRNAYNAMVQTKENLKPVST